MIIAATKLTLTAHMPIDIFSVQFCCETFVHKSLICMTCLCLFALTRFAQSLPLKTLLYVNIVGTSVNFSGLLCANHDC